MDKKEHIKEIITPYGRLVPNCNKSDIRKKYREPVTYFEEGGLESIYLEKPQKIRTSVGTIAAELMTFYPNGQMKRLFPLYGQIGGYWTEEDEYNLAEKVTLKLLGQEFHVAPLCIAFYPSGKAKSLTIWRRENISVNTGYGQVQSNFGFELYENGNLKSIEPAFGVSLKTDYGILYPYDSENYRLHAEGNSLVFDESGRLRSAKSLKNKIRIAGNKKEQIIQPSKIEDPLTGTERLSSIGILFEESGVSIEDEGGWHGPFENSMVSFL